MVADGSRRKKAGLGELGLAGPGLERSLMGCQGRSTLEPAPESLARRTDGLARAHSGGYER